LTLQIDKLSSLHNKNQNPINKLQGDCGHEKDAFNGCSPRVQLFRLFGGGVEECHQEQ
jgi:hypothetical protein